jgi:quercetin dioxygenase-like cupin family protein
MPIRMSIACVAITGLVSAASAQQPGASSIARTQLLEAVLPAGNFRDVQASLIELAPGASAVRHRHDVAVLAYVVEGTVENRFNGGPTQTHKAGQSWWEAPGTVHDAAKNPSQTARARLLIVYIGEPGKTPTVPLK